MILYVFALEEEAGTEFQFENVLFTGIGGINAAYALTKKIGELDEDIFTNIDLVLNLGTAGGKYHSQGTIVNPTIFKHLHSGTTNNETYKGKQLFKYFGCPTTCYSSDEFVTDAKNHVVDMEAYALAKVCHNEGIPFACLKYITDNSDQTALSDWEANLPKAAKALREAVNSLNLHFA